MNYMGGAQIIISTLNWNRLQHLQKSQQIPNCEIKVIWPQLIRILCISLISKSMHYHTHEGHGQLFKPKYHFVTNLQPWNISKNWPKCNHYICNYMQLLVICNYIWTFLQLFLVLVIFVTTMQLVCDNFNVHPSM